MKKSKKREPKQEKLKTMNEISAAEAVKLFEAAVNFPGSPNWYDGDPESDYKPIDGGFPTGICARDFLECLRLYMGLHIPMDYETTDPNITEVARKIIEQITDGELRQLSPQQRKIVELLRINPNQQIKEIAFQLDVKTGTVKSQLTAIYARLKLPGGLQELKTKV
jgi:DNA-binding CsgD family transcriptional regulator